MKRLVLLLLVVGFAVTGCTPSAYAYGDITDRHSEPSRRVRRLDFMSQPAFRRLRW